MSKFIPLSVPNLKGNELQYVINSIESEWVSTGGSYINELENNISKYLKIKAAVACQSGTAALHLALQLCGVTSDDEVIVPTLTFIAAVNPVKYIGADPIFMDCDDTLNMDLDKLEKFCQNECIQIDKILINKKTNKQIKALVIVHVFGNMINMERIMQIADKYNLKVIEDATEALGTYCTEGKYKGKFAGTIGDFGAYSFNGNKIITTGGGGMLVSNNTELLGKAKYLSTQAKDDELYYKHDEVGYNYRMTNVQAAIGVAQLEQLEKFIKVKTENYEIYKKELNTDDVSILDFNKNTRANYWFYSLVIKSDKLNRDELLRKLNENKIQTRPIWGLVHEQKPYRNNQKYKIEKANYFHDRVLNIPCSSNLNKKDVFYIIQIIKSLVD